jgi:hypothetical protein
MTTMNRPSWGLGEVDIERPNPGRVHDFYLGGAHNFAADRELARKALELEPNLRDIIRSHRAFLQRAVRFLISVGIRQFVDLGSGLPTLGNVHEVALAACPDTKVVYADIDPVVVAHGRALVAGEERVTVLRGDVRQPERIFGDPCLRSMIDLDRPVAVMLLAVLHFVRDEEDPAGIVRQVRDTITSDSYVAVSHGTGDRRPGGTAHEDLYERYGGMIRLRPYAEVAHIVAGLDLVEPGLVFAPQWRPDAHDGDAQPTGGLVAVGRNLTGRPGRSSDPRTRSSRCPLGSGQPLTAGGAAPGWGAGYR